MKTPTPLLLILLLAMTSLACTGPSPTAKADGHNPPAPPNIIFIITDDQERRELGFLENQSHTPHLDALAAGGTYFSNCYVNSSVCTPSRYGVMTGQYASRSETDFFKRHTSAEGVTQVVWNPGLMPDQPTLPSVLKEAGYATGFVGKWHIGSLKRAPGPKLEQGADPADQATIARLKANQASFAEDLRTKGFDFADAIYSGNPDDDQELKRVGLNVHHQEWVTRGGLNFIDQSVAQDKPFFLYFSTTLTHVPKPLESLKLDPRVSPIGMLDAPIEGVQPSRADVIARGQQLGIPEELWGSMWLDDGIGALTAKLREHGIEDNTLIVYFVDHGMEFRSKGTSYQGGLISPTLFFWPGQVPAGKTQDALIQNIDFAPTFLELAGATPPASMVIDGKSLVELIRGSDAPVRKSVFSELGLTRTVVTADGWKYLAFHVPPSLQRTTEERLADHKKRLSEIHTKHPWTRNNPHYALDPEAKYFQLGMAAGGNVFERNQLAGNVPFRAHYFDAHQLFNLNADPDETTNLADDPKYADKLAEMQAELTVYLDSLPGTYGDLKPSE